MPSCAQVYKLCMNSVSRPAIPMGTYLSSRDTASPARESSNVYCLCCRYGSGTEDQPDQGTDSLPERPEFPPTSLNLVPAFAADLPQKEGSDILMVAAFLQSFSGLLGLSSVTVDNLLAAGQHLNHFALPVVRFLSCMCLYFAQQTFLLSSDCVLLAATQGSMKHIAPSNI